MGEFEDVLNALHRIADLNPKELDSEVRPVLHSGFYCGITCLFSTSGCFESALRVLI